MSTCISVNYNCRYIIVSESPNNYRPNDVKNVIYLEYSYHSFSSMALKVGRHEVSRGILAKKNLYEGNQQSEVTPEKKNGAPKTEKENGVISKKQVVVEKKDAKVEKTESKGHMPRTRMDSDSYGKQFK